MMAIAWKDEEKTITKDALIRGVVVGENEVTLDEMWKYTPKFNSNGRI
jgi:hypothetical protein